MALTPIYQLKTFADLVSAIREELKIQATDTTATNRIKRDLNITYLEEVIPFSSWKWLRGTFDATVSAAITNGTATVTQNSNTVVLTSAIGSPKEGFLFSAQGNSEIYRIAAHTANSATIVLSAPYTGATSSAASYKIWTDEVFLPSFVRETFEITCDFQDQVLENCGLQKFRGYVAALPRAEGRPLFYTTSTYKDPIAYATPSGLPAAVSRASSALTKTLVFASDVSNYLQQGDRIKISSAGDASYNGEFVIASQSTTTITFTGVTGTYEATTADTSFSLQKLQPANDARRAKRIQIYPAIFNQNTTLHIDFIREAVGLADDTDEPLMPIGDRTILLYGALNRAWSRERNPEEAKRNFDLFTLKLQRMAGKMDDSIDQPQLRPDRIYLGSKRMAQRQKDSRTGLPEGWGGGGSGGNVVTGTANRAAQFDSTGTLTASLVNKTELGQLSGILSSAVGISDTQTISNKTLLTSDVFADATTATKKLAFSLSTQSASTTSTLAFLSTSNRTYTFPDATDTMVNLSSSQTLTNKTIDASLNTLTKIDVSMMTSTGVAATRVPFSDGSSAIHWQQINAQSISSSGASAKWVPFADGSGNTNFGAINAQSISSSAAASGTVLTADGSGNSSFATPTSAPDSSFFVENLSFASSISSSALTLTFKDKTGATLTGSSQAQIGFRNSTASIGTYNFVALSSAVSVTVPVNTNLSLFQGVQNALYLYAINNAGSIKPALSPSNYWDESRLQNVNAITGGNSSTALYADTSFSSVPIRLVGKLEVVVASSAYPNAPTNLSNLPIRTGKQFVMGPLQASNGTASSAAYVAPTNNLSVQFTAERSANYRLYTTTLDFFNSASGQTIGVQIASSAGFTSPILLGPNPQALIDATTGYATALNDSISLTGNYYLSAGSTYCFHLQVKTASGTATLSFANTNANLIAEEI